MSAWSFMHSSLWQTAGWSMLHFVWVGSVIAALAGFGKAALRSASPERRYAFALGCFTALAVAPIFIALCFPHPRTDESVPPKAVVSAPEFNPLANDLGDGPAIAALANGEAIGTAVEPTNGETPTETVSRPVGIRLLSLGATYLPWVWLTGAPLILLALASGLVGIERLKRQTSIVTQGELAAACEKLAATLGIVRRVTVGVCDRLAAPVLVGIVRPMILLPSAALTGWTVGQLEMVLLHELAHVRRWDSFVNLVQRMVEGVLFFHPAVWWLSSWIRLERELCCDRIVIARTGAPQAYAEVLAALASPSRALCGTGVAMGEHNLVTRIRRILNLEDRSMKISTKVVGFVAALMFASVAIIGLYAQNTQPVDNGKPTAKPADPEPPPTARDKPKNADPPALPPVTLPGAKRAIDKKAGSALEFSGEVEAYEQVAIHARIAGNVEVVHVKIGDRVKKGQILVELAAPEMEIDLRQKKAVVDQAVAEVELAKRSVEAAKAALSATKAGIVETEAGIRSAQANLDYRKREMDRFKDLFDKKAIDQQLVDQSRAHLESAQAGLAAAQAKGQAAKAFVVESEAKVAKTDADLRVSQAKMEVTNADVQRAQLMLRYAQLRAPFDGLVTRRNVDAGSFVTSPDRGKSDPLLVVVRTDLVRVVVNIPERIVGQIAKETPATIRADAIKGSEFPAKITRLAGAFDPATRTLRAELDLNNADGKLLPGMYVTVAIVLPK